MSATRSTAPDGVILAGGRGTRMATAGGAMGVSRDTPPDPKPWMLLGGIPLVERAARQLAPQVNQLFISTQDQPARYAHMGRPVPDASAQRLGPLAGILAALDASQADWLAVAPCDSPFLPDDWVVRLQQAARAHDAPLALATHGGWRQPLCMIVHRDRCAGLQAAIKAGVRKVGQWQHEAGALTVDFSDAPAHAFMNINTPAELAQAEALLRQSG